MELQDLFRFLHQLAGRETDQLHNIEEEVDRMEEYTGATLKELNKAEANQERYNSKVNAAGNALWFVVAVVVLGVIIMVVMPIVKCCGRVAKESTSVLEVGKSWSATSRGRRTEGEGPPFRGEWGARESRAGGSFAEIAAGSFAGFEQVWGERRSSADEGSSTGDGGGVRKSRSTRLIKVVRDREILAPGSSFPGFIDVG